MKEEFERIKGILKETNSWFKVIKHKPVFTSEEAARARGVELRQGVKAMVFKLKEKFVVALVPADRKVDTKKLKKLVGGKPKLASPKEVFAVTNCKIGAVPPFGHKTKLEIFADIGIFANDMVDFNAGLNEVSIQMHGNDLKKVLSKVGVVFCEIRK